MPVTIKKLKGGGYRVSTPNGVHAKNTTLKNAKAQKRILEATERGAPVKSSFKSNKKKKK